MKLSLVFFLLAILGCQTQKKDTVKTEKLVEFVKTEKVHNKTPKKEQQENIQCDNEVCLQLRNHDTSNKSFDIYILNSVPVAGFQCDFPGINIIGSDGGLLKENEYQTSNSAIRILSFSMKAKLIPVGEGVLTTVIYSESAEEWLLDTGDYTRENTTDPRGWTGIAVEKTSVSLGVNEKIIFYVNSPNE